YINNNLKSKLEIKSEFKNNVYDDLGAGDIFIGYLLSNYYNDFNKSNFKNLLKKASEAAGEACQYEGASNLSLV
ncbi:MAG: PfkB family carbohydrate kinase, partial [Halarsenatibacteraceae bacterium]